MSLNFLLLSIFAKNTNFGSDINAFRERYNVLAVIYANLCFILMIPAYEGVAKFFFGIQHAYKLMFVTIPSVAISLIYLKQGKTKIAAIIVLIYMHCINFSCSFLNNGPMVGLYGLMTFPYFVFFLSSSKKIHIINAFFCSCEYVYHVYKIQQSFDVTFTEEQAMHIITLMLSALFGPGFLSIACFLQKGVESSMWRLAQSNHEKSEKLNHEIMRMMNFKQDKTLLMSRGVIYSLESMVKSIKYLLEVVQNPDQVQILKNIKLSSEIITEFLNNELDDFISKMKVECTETSVLDVVQKTLVINSESLRKREISAVVSIDDNVPQVVGTDTTKLLQILLNLFTQAVDSAVKGSKILMHVTCQSHKETEKEPSKQRDDDSEFGVKTHRRTNSKNELEEFFPSNVPGVNVASPFYTRNLQDVKAFKVSPGVPSKPEPWAIYTTHATDDKNESLKKRNLRIHIQYSRPDFVEDNIWRIFNGVENSLNREVDLGLLICKQFCQKLGGDIKLHSKSNNEVVFIFHVPINEDITSNQTQLRKIRFYGKPRAMIAEDYASQRDLLKLILEKEGVEVVSVSNGQEAVDSYKASEDDYYDFLVIDTHITKIDGFTAVEMIRERESQQHRRKIDVYFTSDCLSGEELRGEIKTKFTEADQHEVFCLEKPFNPDSIKSIVDRYKGESKQKGLDLSMQENERKNFSSLNLLEDGQETGIRNRKKQGTI